MPASSDPGPGAELLVDAIQRLSLARTVGEVQEIVRTTARRLCGADGATFVLRDGDRCYYADEDAISPLWKGQRFPMESCISGWAMRHREAVGITDIYADERIPHDAYRPTFVRSLAMVPIRQLEPIGAIGNYWAETHPPTAQELRWLQALADSTAVAMENVQLWGQLEARVADRTKRLQDALDLAERVLGTLAHEVRNCLGAAGGLIDVSLTYDAAQLGHEPRDHLRHAASSVSDGVRLLDQQMLAARDRAGELRTEPTEVSIAELFAELAATYSALRPDENVALVIDLPADVPVLVTDAHLLKQALRNLISNALKFTDKGEVRLRARTTAGKVELSVADTGCGIAPEDQERILQPWGQVEGAQPIPHTGSGLGLPFVQSTTRLLGGELRLASQLGGGATFTLTFPLAAA